MDEDLDRVSQRTISAAGAPPAGAPAAFSSPFALGRSYAKQAGIDLDKDVSPRTSTSGPSPANVKRSRREAAVPANQLGAAERKRLGVVGNDLTPMARARLTLESCGAITVEQLAETIQEDLASVRRLVTNAVTRGAFERVDLVGGEKGVQLKTSALPGDDQPKSGLKRFLKRQGDKATSASRKPSGRKATAKARNPAAKRAVPGRATRAATRPRKAPVKAVRAPRQPRAAVAAVEPALRAQAPVLVPEAALAGFACGLYSNGELRIEDDGKELRLTRAKARALVDYLDKLSSAMEG